jgi:hypothetical protein
MRIITGQKLYFVPVAFGFAAGCLGAGGWVNWLMIF